jgi:hypothetical protein
MSSRHASSIPRSLLRASFWAVLVLCLLPASARAASVNVNCTAVAPPPGVFTSIAAALATLDNTGPHTVTVTGPCTESVNINQRDRLTIQAPVGSPATISPPAPGPMVVNINGSHNITLRNLVLSGGGNGLVVSRGSTVTLQGLLITGNLGSGIVVNLGSVANLGGTLADQSVTVSDNEGNGIGSDASVLAVAGGLTVEDNGGVGLNVIGGRLTVNGGQVGNVFRNNGVGINLDGTIANFNGLNTIQNNGPTGVQVVSGRVGFGGAVVEGVPRVTTIEGHTLGVNVAGAGSVNFGGPNRIRNNGIISDGPDPDPQFRGGIRVGTVSRVQFDGGTEITGNTGYGVLLDFNGALSLTNAVVSNNTTFGVRVARSSVGGFGLGNTFAGNGGPHISCDDTSLIHGTGLTGFGKGIECKSIEHEKGPSRPSVPKEHD